MTIDPEELLRPCIATMEGYVPGEQPPDAGYVKLNTNENPYPPSRRVLDRIRAACSEDLRLYPDASAESVRRRLAALFDVPVEQTMVGNGSDELLNIILRAFVEPGQHVAYPTPTYSYYQQLVQIQGGRVHALEFPEDYTLPVALAHTHARVILLANPNSPSGTLIPLDQIDELASRVSAILVLDEAYVDFATNDTMGLIQRHPHVIITRTMSKSYSLAGMRLGFAFAAPGIITQLWKIKDHYNINRVGLAAAAAALDDVATMRIHARRICATRERLSRSLRELGFQVWDSQANFVLARRTQPQASHLYQELKRRRILVRYFDTPRLRDCLRISVGTEEQITELLEQLRDTLDL